MSLKFVYSAHRINLKCDSIRIINTKIIFTTFRFRCLNNPPEQNGALLWNQMAKQRYKVCAKQALDILTKNCMPHLVFQLPNDLGKKGVNFHG